MRLHEGLPLAALAAIGDMNDAEDEGNKKVAEIFKKTARDWEAWLRSMTGKRWKVKAGDYTLSMTSPKGQMIDVMWDFDPMFEKVDITVEGPGGKSKTFSKQGMGKLASGKRAAPMYLTWIMNTVIGESRDAILDAVVEMEEGVGTKISSLSEEIHGILTEKRMGREAGGAKKGPGGAGTEVKYGMHPMEKSGKPGARKYQKKTYNRAVRRQKRKEIERRMKGEATFSNALAYLDALVQEGITEIPVFSLTERTQLDRGLERALNNLVSVGQSHRMRGAWIEKWANDALATGRLDVASLLDMASKATIARETKAVAAAIGRVASLAASAMSEAEEVMEADHHMKVGCAGCGHECSSKCSHGKGPCPECGDKLGLVGAPNTFTEDEKKILAALKQAGYSPSRAAVLFDDGGDLVYREKGDKFGEVLLKGAFKGSGKSVKAMAAVISKEVPKTESVTESRPLPPPTVGPVPSATPEEAIIQAMPKRHETTTPDEGGAVAASPAREHTGRNFPSSTLKDELQMILRGDTISAG